MKLTSQKLRVLHYPQIPCIPFIVEVKDEIEANKIYNALADQHLFLFENNFIPDYSNAIIVQMWDDELEEDEKGDKWTDYWNDAEGMEWDEFQENYL